MYLVRNAMLPVNVLAKTRLAPSCDASLSVSAAARKQLSVNAIHLRLLVWLRKVVQHRRKLLLHTSHTCRCHQGRVHLPLLLLLLPGCQLPYS